jgi:hypothetical protein
MYFNFHNISLKFLETQEGDRTHNFNHAIRLSHKIVSTDQVSTVLVIKPNTLSFFLLRKTESLVSRLQSNSTIRFLSHPLKMNVMAAGRSFFLSLDSHRGVNISMSQAVFTSFFPHLQVPLYSNLTKKSSVYSKSMRNSPMFYSHPHKNNMHEVFPNK